MVEAIKDLQNPTPKKGTSIRNVVDALIHYYKEQDCAGVQELFGLYLNWMKICGHDDKKSNAQPGAYAETLDSFMENCLIADYFMLKPVMGEAYMYASENPPSGVVSRFINQCLDLDIEIIE